MQMHRNPRPRLGTSAEQKSADRRVGVADLSDDADGLALTLTDEDGLSVTRHAPLALEPARDGERALASLREQLAKLATRMFVARDITLRLRQPWFAPASLLNALRRDAVAELQALRVAQWPRRRAKPGRAARRLPGNLAQLPGQCATTWPASFTPATASA